MRVLFTIIGAVVGLSLASGSQELLGIFLGAFAGWGAGEFRALWAKLQELDTELGALRRIMAQRAKREDEATPTAAPARPVEPEQAPPTPPSAGPWEPYGVATKGSAPLPAAATRTGTPTSTPGYGATPLGSEPGAAPSHSATVSTPASASESIAEPTGAATTPGRGAASRVGQGTRPRAPGRARQPPTDDPIDSIARIVREYFTGGNTLVRVGIIILFFGVAFLLRYVAEHSHVPIEFRLSGVALGGIVLLVLGWRLRAKRPGYALALQGGAVGILYLTVFAGLRIYSVLPPGAAFALLVFVAAFSAALAILQNSQSFALLAVTGGFLAPILASTGQGDHVILFSYYAVLNGGILAIAWFKAWRPLNLAGFLFTFVIGTAWGVLSYEPRLFATTEPFLVLFFLFYVAIAILFATRQPPELRGYVDGTLVFGTPIVAFGLQSAMLHDRHFALAYSALAVSGLYLVIAALLHRSRQASQRLLVEAFMALGVLFLTLAVPLALDGRWSAATWAVEGAALVWIGCRQDRRLPRAFGALLQIAGGVIFLFDIDAPHGNVPILNSTFIGGVMVSAASVFSSAMLERNRNNLVQTETGLAPVLFFWGVLWWLYSGLTEIHRRVAPEYEIAAGLLLMAVTALICSALFRRARISFASYPVIGLLPVMLVYAGIAVLQVQHPFANGGWIAWPLTFAAFYFVCKRHEGEPGRALANSLHVGSTWLLTALVTWEVYWEINEGVAGGGSWPAIAWALVPSVVLFALPRLTRRIDWPLGTHREAYLGVAASGVALYLALWSLTTNLLLAGDPRPLPFVPLLNPLDLAELFVLLVLLRFWLQLRSALSPEYEKTPQGPVLAGLAVLAFVWLNAALLRAIHHLAGVPFEVEPMLRSTLVQTSLSIFWTVLALTTMLVATRTRARIVWLTGAGLLGVVIAKLFLVDLSRVGTIERIVSFVGVGVLMLVIGYFSPLPPAADKDEPEPTRV